MAAAASNDWFGSDTVVELLETHGIDTVAFNPGASFRGIHDSLVNGKDRHLDLVTCTLEGVAVAVAHGFAKATGRPMAVMLHNVVGLQLASMAIFNAWVDRVPMLLVGGTGPVSVPARRPWIDWIHTALVQGTQVRDYVKWDDQPADLASLPESFRRAIATTVSSPPGPVYVCVDAGIQEQEADRPDPAVLAPHPIPTSPAPAPDEVEWLATQLTRARMPVLVTDYAGDTDVGYTALRELAEFLHAPVIDAGARCSFDGDHELNFSEIREVLAEADLVVGFDVEDLYLAIGTHVLAHEGDAVRKRQPFTLVHVTPAHYKQRSWAADYQRLMPLDRLISGGADVALPAVLAACRARSQPAEVDERRAMLAGRVAARRADWAREAADAEAQGAVHPARLAAAIWQEIQHEQWVLVNGSLEGWERRLWSFHGPRRHLGWHGGGGLGYGMGAAIGATLALGDDHLCVNLQADGDLLFTPSALWTAANRGVPLLTIVHNNRQYRNSVDHATRIAEARGRPTETRYVGTSITDPAVDYAALARSFGMKGIGPLSHRDELQPALKEALDVVRGGKPVLVDVLTAGS